MLVKRKTRLRVEPAKRAAIGRKIAATRKALGLSQQAFAQALSSSQSSVTRWENGVDNPPIAALNLLADMVPDEDRQYWLELAGIPDTPQEAPTRKIEVLRDSAAAGTPRAVDEREVSYAMNIPHRLLPIGGKLQAVTVEGESMSPILHTGYVVVVDVSKRELEHLLEKMVLARDDDGVTIKWLRIQDGVYMLVPQKTSPRYPIRVVNERTGISIVGEVVGWYAPYQRAKG